MQGRQEPSEVNAGTMENQAFGSSLSQPNPSAGSQSPYNAGQDSMSKIPSRDELSGTPSPGIEEANKVLFTQSKQVKLSQMIGY